MKKGFTLIELLAVIVILAIIALIATPVILNIIDDARDSSNKESINLYAKAIENAVANYLLENPTDTNITLEKIKEYIKYDGNKVECDTININSNGSIYLKDCKVNDIDVEYTYGEYTGEVYRNSTELIYIGDSLDFTYETNLANISQNYYLKHDVVNDVVTASYACITYTENGTRKDACVRGGYSTYYASNQAILRSVEPYFNTLDYSSSSTGKGSCYFDESASSCDSGSFRLNAHSDGYVRSYDGSAQCYVYSDGNSRCIE